MIARSHGLPAAAALVGVMVGVCAAMLFMVIGLCALRNRVQSKDSSDGHNSPVKSSGSTMHKKCTNLSAKRLLSMKKKKQNRRYENDGDGGGGGNDDDDLSEVEERSALDSPMWQRSILMGERCEPPAFSGLILYDEHGNLVQELPWKSPRTVPHHPSPSLRQLMTAT